MKIVISGIDNYSSTNSLGIQAMSDGIINKVGEIYPNAELILHFKTLIPSKTEWRWLKFIEGYPIFNKPTIAYLYGKFKRQQQDRVEEIKRADRLIVSGDGIIADIFTGWGLSLAFEMMVAIENNITCYFVNQSINVSAKSILGYVVSQFFPKCHISVREGISARLLNQLFGLEKTPISIDSAFFVAPLNNLEKEQFAYLITQLKERYRFDNYIIVGVRGKRPTDQSISVESWVEVIKELMLRFPSQKVVFVS